MAWLLPARSGQIYRNASGKLYTGTAGVPVNVDDVDVSGALIDGWTRASTQTVPAQGALTPTIAAFSTDPLTGGIRGLSASNGLVSTLGLRTTPLRVATFGDSTANIGDVRSPANQDVSQASSSAWQAGTISLSSASEKWCIPVFYPQAYLVANGGITGQTTTQMVARDTLAASVTRRATQDVIDLAPNVVLFRGGSINDLMTVTSATIDSVVATTYANHCLIIQRFLAAGIPVLDSGVFGFSGSATDLAQTRLALLRLNALYKTYAAQYPGRVEFVDPLNRVSDATGAYIAGMSGDGTHLNISGGLVMGAAESDALARLFGNSVNSRFQGKNVIANASLAATGVVGHGVQATNFGISASNATRQNAKIEVINGKTFQTCEFLITAGTNNGQINMPFDPSATGTGMTAALGITTNDVYGFEFDFYIEPLNGATFTVSNLTGRVDVRDSVGSGRIVLDTFSVAYTNGTISAPLQGHLSFPPVVFGDVQANLTNASVFYFLFGAAEASGAYKVGVSQPRIVKLNQAVVTT